MIDLLRQENDNLRAGRIADELVGRKLLAENELRRHVVGGIVPEGEESIAALGQLADERVGLLFAAPLERD